MEPTLSFPVELLLFMGLVSVSLIFRRHQLGLMATYAFVFYLGFLFNEHYFILEDGRTSWTAYLYGISGIWVVSFVLIGLMKEKQKQIRRTPAAQTPPTQNA